MKDNTQNYFLLTAIIGVVILTFFIFKPFIYVLALAAVFAVLFQPIHDKILTKTNNREGISALITAFIVLAFIFIPVLFIGFQIFAEAAKLYNSLISGSAENLINQLSGVFDSVRSYFPSFSRDSLDIQKYVEIVLGSVVQNFGSIFSNFAKIFANVLIFLIALYYLLKDGDKLRKSVAAMSPLPDEYDEVVFKKLNNAIHSVVRGNLIIALIQGLMTGIGLFIFGVPNPIFWATVASIAALIPALGTSLVIVPAVIYLFITSNPFFGLGLILWGITAVGLIDNYLLPKIVGQKANLHPLLVLLSVLGGLIFYGPIGFILGPLTLSLLFALAEIYVSYSKSKKPIV